MANRTALTMEIWVADGARSVMAGRRLELSGS